MNKEPKSIWKKTWDRNWLGSLLLALISSVIILFIGALTGLFSVGVELLAMWLLFVLVLWPLIAFIRWLCCWRNFKKFAFVIVCLVTLLALLFAEENWRGKHDCEKFKREWEAQGERFDYASIVPPPVPDDQNFAMTPLMVDSIKFQYGANVAKQWYGVTLTESERTNLVNRLSFTIYGDNDSKNWPPDGRWNQATKTDLKSWQNYYRTLATQTNLFPVAPQPLSPAQDVLLALSKYDSAAKELQAASRLPYSRFPIFANADNPFDTLLPHLSVLKSCVRYFQLLACAELQNGENGKALDDTKLAIELGEKIRNEPFIISHLVRIALVQLALQPVYEGLADHRWSDEQLAELDMSLARLDFINDYEKSMRGERVASISALEYIRRTRDTGILQPADSKHMRAWWSRLLIPDAFFSQNILTVARMQQLYVLPAVNSVSHCAIPAEVRRLSADADVEINHHWWPYTMFARMLLPAIKNTVEKYVRGQSSVDLGRVAIALERYRLAHGEYPESLDALAPQFIAKVPHDVIGGQPLKYRREADGQFMLYSIGWNERDDGGVVILKKGSTPEVDANQGDWVWRYPAK